MNPRRVLAALALPLAALTLTASDGAAVGPAGCASGESVTIEIPGPRAFITSDEWCALTGR